jgi:hypothetical protein
MFPKQSEDSHQVRSEHALCAWWHANICVSARLEHLLEHCSWVCSFTACARLRHTTASKEAQSRMRNALKSSMEMNVSVQRQSARATLVARAERRSPAMQLPCKPESCHSAANPKCCTCHQVMLMLTACQPTPLRRLTLLLGAVHLRIMCVEALCRVFARSARLSDKPIIPLPSMQWR